MAGGLTEGCKNLCLNCTRILHSCDATYTVHWAHDSACCTAWESADLTTIVVAAYFPHKPSLRRRVSLELRKGTNTKPFFLALPKALMHSAKASKDLHNTCLAAETNHRLHLHAFDHLALNSMASGKGETCLCQHRCATAWSKALSPALSSLFAFKRSKNYLYGILRSCHLYHSLLCT